MNVNKRIAMDDISRELGEILLKHLEIQQRNY